jgi:hypothetical protein
MSQAGKNNCVPKWLAIWNYIALFAGLLNVIAMYFGGLTIYGFIIIPVGMGWMVVAGIVHIRKNLSL